MSLPRTSVRAQDDAPLRVLEKAFNKGDLMVALAPVNWRTGLALTAAHLPAGETITLEVYLSRRHTYAFVATTEDDRSDLDLYVRDSTGTVLTSDREPDGTPVVEFRVARTGNYRVQLHLAAATAGEDWVGLALLQSRGQPLAEQTFRKATNNLLRAMEPGGEPPAWATAPGYWAVQLILPGERSGLSLTGLGSTQGVRRLRGTALPASAELALYLATAGGLIVGQSPPGEQPVELVIPPGPGTHDLRLETRGGREGTIVLLGATSN